MYDGREITDIYRRAQVFFSRTHPEWVCSIENDCFVIQLRQNTSHFYGMALSHSARVYRHVVKVFSDGRFVTLDTSANDESAVGLEGIVLGKNAFSERPWCPHCKTKLGTEPASETPGLLAYDFTEQDIRIPVKRYFQEQGLKFGSFSVLGRFRALDHDFKRMFGMLFLVTGSLLMILMFLKWSDEAGVVTSYINGVTTFHTVADVSLYRKVLSFLFPGLLIGSGLFLLWI